MASKKKTKSEEEQKTNSKTKGSKKKTQTKQKTKPTVKANVSKEKKLKPLSLIREKKNEVVWMDLSVDGDDSQRIEIVIFSGIVKKTAANFVAFCTGKNKLKKSYKGTCFHRMIPGFMLQGGDIENGDGTGSISIYGEQFVDENFKIKHCQYVLSMANAGPNTNGSQFFICTDECAHLDDKHVVFGYIADKKSQKIIDQIEEDGSSLDGTPQAEVKIVKCG
eukprot:CAMPEP_0202690696 /NCGR_PEP_ID=MMETSP1385-20130828/5613_1 /ASSEMBLY_ACC=CAM_ASM_000861 /TAXON_ID=933848 /ORGANISM="Elphidium margaritaceum" /LENGTH=220 /DNA_ID=CAMNT_0049345981 /DNA_START=11 /DNA_END=670 /DNA_ORIENTATION=+